MCADRSRGFAVHVEDHQVLIIPIFKSRIFPTLLPLIHYRFNYFFAMVYNVIMIPVAAGVLYPLTHCQLPPWVAGACMAFSSVSVVCSSLLIRRFRPTPISPLKPEKHVITMPTSLAGPSALGNTQPHLCVEPQEANNSIADVEEGQALLPGQPSKNKLAQHLSPALGRWFGRKKTSD